MSRFRRRLMGLAALRQAKADDFVRVEYIENTSNAYIDTGIIANQNTNYEIKVQFTKSTNYPYIFGTQEADRVRRFSLMEGSWKAFYYSANLHTQEINLSLTAEQQTSNLVVKKDGLIMYVDGEKKGTFSNTNFTTPSTLTIFTCHYANGQVHNNVYKGRFYYFKIYDGTTLVRDYIPMYQISTDTYGLWDRVEKKFYTSPNGTKFIGGHQIIYDAEIEYLRGTNPQYIDTGIIPNNSTGVYAVGYKFAGSDSFMLGCRNNNSNTRWAIGKSNTGWYYGWNTYNNSGIGGNPADIYLNYKNDGLFKVTSTDGTKTMSLPSLSFTPIYNIRLFGSAGVNANYTKWNGAIYKVTITQGTEIIMDLIPVRVGNVGYMYDKVSGKLFGNNGSGSFILGQDTVVYDKI